MKISHIEMKMTTIKMDIVKQILDILNNLRNRVNMNVKHRSILKDTIAGFF